MHYEAVADCATLRGMDEVEEMETVVGRLYGLVPTACAYTTYWQGVRGLSDLCGQPAAYELTSKFVPGPFLVCVEHGARARVSLEIQEWMVCMRTWPRPSDEPAASPRY